MSKVERLRDRARTAEARDPRAAIDTWLEVLRFEEDDAEPNPDLSIYNRIGDLYLKIKDPGQAADYYERGVDRYAELGFHNNAIALCNKVLRNAPGRPTTYLKLAKLYAAKGFHAEARQNFVEYAERMKRAGQVDRAFAALKQVTDLSPESDSLRRMLEEHLRTYGDVKGRPGRPSTIAEAPPPPTTPEPKTAKRKTSSLVFLDLDEPKPGRDAPAPTAKAPPPPAAKAAASPHAPPAPAAKPAPRAPEPRKGGQDLEYVGGRESAGVEPLAVEPTAVGEDAVPPAASALEGLETTSFDFHEVRRSLTSLPRIADDQIPDVAVPTLGGLEPTAEPEPDVTETGEPTIAGFEEEATVVEPTATAPPVTPEPRRATPPPAPPRRTTPPARHAPPEPPAPPRREAAPTSPRHEAPPAPPKREAPPPSPRREAPPAPPPREAAPPVAPRETPPAAPRERPPVEVPPLEMEPEFESTGAGPGHDIDDEPLLVDSDDVSSWIQREDQITAPPPSGRSQGFIDLGVEGITIGDAYHPRVIGSGALPGVPSIDELESRVADNPDDPDAHRSLGEALIEDGDRERGIEELDLASTGYEAAGNLQQAQDLLNEVLRLDPNSVRHRQRVVEYAYRAGDRDALIEAYLELADALLRNNLADKAQAVYERVAEHDPHNARAQAALGMLTAPPAAPGRVPPEGARMRVRDETTTVGDFVDLGAMVLDETDEPIRDTRMKVEDEAPTGDEERDFQEMLARFKQGIDENIDETDFQSHYDLGVAFKEMGLLDEAISEFQKALRAPEGKLRTSEALGVCFFEKGALGVAESILRRGLELPASGDQERLGVLYWLARSLEGQGRISEARDYYGRVFAVDIRFMDVGERVRALSRA
jgi:tetratricopeptide (TPR) repeat protein